jgi:hypothetical protein
LLVVLVEISGSTTCGVGVSLTAGWDKEAVPFITVLSMKYCTSPLKYSISENPSGKAGKTMPELVVTRKSTLYREQKSNLLPIFVNELSVGKV